jgi:hypothetical protein
VSASVLIKTAPASKGSVFQDGAILLSHFGTFLNGLLFDPENPLRFSERFVDFYRKMTLLVDPARQNLIVTTVKNVKSYILLLLYELF